MRRHLPAIEPPGSSSGQMPGDPAVGQRRFRTVRRDPTLAGLPHPTVTAEDTL